MRFRPPAEPRHSVAASLTIPEARAVHEFASARGTNVSRLITQLLRDAGAFEKKQEKAA